MQVYSHDYSLSFLDALEEVSAGAEEGTTRPDVRFEAMVLRLHSVIDVAGLWSAVQFVCNELVPNDACILHLNRKILATANAQTFYKWMAHRPEQHLIPTAILANPETKVCQLSDVVFDPRQLFHSEFFLRHMAPQGWHHIACSLFWKDHQLTAEIALTRTAKQGPFTDLEVALLERLHPHIEVTLQRLTALQARDPIVVALRPQAPGLFATLTATERELLHFLRTGMSNKELATRLQKSVRTVKAQLSSIYKKYGVRSRNRLIATILGAAADRPVPDTSVPSHTWHARHEVGDIINPTRLGILRESDVYSIAECVTGRRVVDSGGTTVLREGGCGLLRSLMLLAHSSMRPGCEMWVSKPCCEGV